MGEAQQAAFQALVQERKSKFGYPEPLAQIWSFLEMAVGCPETPDVLAAFPVAAPVAPVEPPPLVGRVVAAAVKEEPPEAHVATPATPATDQGPPCPVVAAVAAVEDVEVPPQAAPQVEQEKKPEPVPEEPIQRSLF